MRYQRVFTEVWNDEKFTAMSAGAQRLFLYLLTCPHSNLIGLYILKNGYMIEDLDLSPQSLNSLLKEVVDSGMVKRCEANNIIFIPNYLRFNALTNPNQVAAAKGIVQSMPKSIIINDFMTTLKGLNEVLDKGQNKALHEGLVSVLVLESVLVSESEDLPKEPKPEKKPSHIIPLLGEHKNVKLTQKQFDNLIEYVNGKENALDLIERLSIYMASKGKTYNNHYATMQGWYRRSDKGSPTITAEQEKKRVDLKRDLRTAEEALKRAEETQQYSPSPENDKRVQGKQREVNKLRKELDI